MTSRTNGCLWNQDPLNEASITSARVARQGYVITSLWKTNGTVIELWILNALETSIQKQEQ